MTTETFSNNATSPLAVSVTTTPAQGTQETWTVNSTSSFPQTPGQARFIIDNEIVIGVTPPASGTTLVVTRGAEGTTPATHAAGIQLKQDATAGSLGVFLQTDTTVPTPSTTVLGARVTSDTFDRLQLQPQGVFLGTGAAAPDVSIYRSSGTSDAGGWPLGSLAVGGSLGIVGRNGLVLPTGGDDAIMWAGGYRAMVGANRSDAYWTPDGLTGDMIISPNAAKRVLIGGAADSYAASWVQFSSASLTSKVPIIVGPSAGGSRIFINAASSAQSELRFQDAGVDKWGLYKWNDSSTPLGLWDYVNNRNHLILTPGATSTAAMADFYSNVQVRGYLNLDDADPAGTLRFLNSGTSGFLVYYSSGLHIHDDINSRDHITLTPGASSTTAITEIASQLQVDGPLITSGGLRTSVGSISATGPITATTTLVNATSGAITATLPSVAAGLRCEVKKTDASANAVTVTPATGTIDGATSFVLTAQYQSVTLVSDGTNWWVV